MHDGVADLLKDVEALQHAQNEGERRGLLSRIECAANALLGQARAPDLGPWSMSPDGRLLSSDNFDHDVCIHVKGDFYGNEDRVAYSKRLIEQLNQTKPLRQGLPVEPPASLLYSMAMRYRHDFGFDRDEENPLSCGFTQDERRALLTTMRQLYEEVSGHGFYQYES